MKGSPHGGAEGQEYGVVRRPHGPPGPSATTASLTGRNRDQKGPEIRPVLCAGSSDAGTVTP
jgi:hypothetical protein